MGWNTVTWDHPELAGALAFGGRVAHLVDVGASFTDGPQKREDRSARGKKGKGISGRRNSLNDSPGGGKSPGHLGRRVGCGEWVKQSGGARLEREAS